MRESWGRVRKWVQIIMMLTGPVVLAIALCNVTSEKLWQARAEEVQQIKKEKGLNGENSVRRAVALEKIQWEKAEKVYDGKREAVLTGYYQEKKEENRVKYGLICFGLIYGEMNIRNKRIEHKEYLWKHMNYSNCCQKCHYRKK